MDLQILAAEAEELGVKVEVEHLNGQAV